MTLLRARIGLAALALAAVVAVAVGCGGSDSDSPKSSSGTSSSNAATRTPASIANQLEAPASADPIKQAPDFTLRNSKGELVRLSQFRGKAVMLTFIYARCPDVCPLIIGNLRAAMKQLGPAANKMEVVAVSVDPEGDTAANVNKFISDHDMTGKMEYLIGSKRELVPVWKNWDVQIEGTPDERLINHSSFVFGITGSGAVVALYPSNFQPRMVAHDTPLLASA
jgi:protein SCO1/2